MASEIKVTAQIEIRKGTLVLPKVGPSSLAITMNGSTAGVPGIVLAATDSDGTTILTTGITTLGWALLVNIHATAIVKVGVLVTGTFHEFATMNPSEPCLIRMSAGKTYALKSDVADSPVQVHISND